MQWMMAVFNVPSIVISKENESGDDDPPEPLITISSSNKKVEVHETSNEEKKEESPSQQSVVHSEHRRPSLKRVSDVLFLAKEWKMKARDKQERRESLKSKGDDATKEHQVEIEAAPIDLSSALPKETLDEIVEEALSIVIKTKQKYKHHLGSNHPLTIKAMKKANDLCAQQQKEPMYNIKE